MSDADAFQSLKLHYFAWLDANLAERPMLLARLKAVLSADEFLALSNLIVQTEASPSGEAVTEVAKTRIGASLALL
jgi:hypothetical protein